MVFKNKFHVWLSLYEEQFVFHNALGNLPTNETTILSLLMNYRG